MLEVAVARMNDRRQMCKARVVKKFEKSENPREGRMTCLTAVGYPTEDLVAKQM
jgi:hypothetical protein